VIRSTLDIVTERLVRSVNPLYTKRTPEFLEGCTSQLSLVIFLCAPDYLSVSIVSHCPIKKNLPSSFVLLSKARSREFLAHTWTQIQAAAPLLAGQLVLIGQAQFYSDAT